MSIAWADINPVLVGLISDLLRKPGAPQWSAEWMERRDANRMIHPRQRIGERNRADPGLDTQLVEERGLRSSDLLLRARLHVQGDREDFFSANAID